MQKRLGLLLSAVLLSSILLIFNQPVAAAESQTFPQTGYTVSDEHGFLAYWRKYGGLAVFGYPISPERQEVNPEDGKTYWVQWFERNRFEWHPENRGTKYEVLLGLLGKQLTKGRENEIPFKRVSPMPNSASLIYFAATGHTLSKGFKTYWEGKGGLEQFGYPLTEEFSERNPEDGKTYIVQWFERARFEYHPENAAPNDVLLGLLGKQALNSATIEPTPPVTPSPTPSPSPTPTPSPTPLPSQTTITPSVDLPLPADAKGLPLTQAEYDDLLKRLSVQGWTDLKFGYFTSKASVNDLAGFYRGALSGAGFTILVDAKVGNGHGFTCYKGTLNCTIIIDQIRPETLNNPPFKGKDVKVGDSFIFLYHGHGRS
jgi:hypothetical protein